MKVLFLDVDGVLVIDGPDDGVTENHFSPSALAELERIVRLTKCRIVLHSSWRYHEHKRDLLNRLLTERGLPPILSYTKHTYLWEVWGMYVPFHSVRDVAKATDSYILR